MVLSRKAMSVGLMLSVFLLSAQAFACPPAADGTVKPSHITSINIHQPGDTKYDLANIVSIFLPIGSGYQVEAKGICSGKLGPILIDNIEKGKLCANVVFTYGRTGEIPPGIDIFKYFFQAKDQNLLSPVFSGRYTIRPAFEELVADASNGGYFAVPYIGTVAIVYNPDLIDRADVPKSWKALADFKYPIAVAGAGCYVMRTLSYLYHTVGEKNFEQIIKKAKMPLDGSSVPMAVVNGESKVGISSLCTVRTQQEIESGRLGVIWPEEGAFMMPHLLVVRANANEADLALVDFIANSLEIRRVLLNEGVSSTLRGGGVLPIIKENDFNFKFVPIEQLIQQDIHNKIIEIVGRSKT